MIWRCGWTGKRCLRLDCIKPPPYPCAGFTQADIDAAHQRRVNAERGIPPWQATDTKSDATDA
jgi:hypothetical protein